MNDLPSELLTDWKNLTKELSEDSSLAAETFSLLATQYAQEYLIHNDKERLKRNLEYVGAGVAALLSVNASKVQQQTIQTVSKSFKVAFEVISTIN